MIDWPANLRAHNRIYKTNYSNHLELLKALYSEYESAMKVGKILCVSNISVLRVMKKAGLEILPKGHRHPSTMVKKLFGLGDVSNLTFNEISRKMGWNREYGYRLLRKHKVNYKKIDLEEMGMIRIDWFEKLELYNRIFNMNYLSIKVMLKNGYKRFGSLKEFAYKLGISDETLRQKLRKEKIKINDPIRPRRKKK